MKKEVKRISKPKTQTTSTSEAPIGKIFYDILYLYNIKLIVNLCKIFVCRKKENERINYSKIFRSEAANHGKFKKSRCKQKETF